MDSRQLIDVQFNRAVEIVQGLPKTGPIQTGYEEKLTMYSLYKQATVGNVTSPRPGIFDMLGRAKWDAWAKHRDLDQYEAKWLYVDALLKALSKYSDKTVAKDLIDELRSFGGHSENLVSSYTLTRTGSRGSSSSSSTTSEGNPHIPPPHGLRDFQHPSSHGHTSTVVYSEPSDDGDGEAGDETGNLPAMRGVPQQQRPPSSISFSSRYKTPLIGSFALSSPPPRRMSVPPVQPLPNFETPSAFADPKTAISVSIPYAAPSSSRDLAPHTQSAPISRHNTSTLAHLRPPSRAISASLEHAIENVQAHLAALTERIDTLETSLATHSHSQAQNSTSSSSHSSDRGSPTDSRAVSQISQWDVDDMGLWTLVLKPLFHHLSSVQRLFLFFITSNLDRSPVLVIVRRLCLDISFVMVALVLFRTAWKRTGARRREVNVALRILWGAVTGKRRIPGGKNLWL